MSDGVVEQAIGARVLSTDMRANLKEIFKADMDTYGHGTRVEAAEEIITVGLKVKSPDLSGTTIGLFDEKPFEEQIDGVLGKINKWPHLESKAIVIIVLPSFKKPLKESIEPIKGIRNQSRTAPFLREIPGEHDASYDLPYILPPNYIKGFVDVKKNKFIKNPLFNPTPPESIANRGKKKSNPKTPTKPVADGTPPYDLLP